MKKLIMITACAAVCGLVAGCFTSATARTKKTMPDGTVTESYVGIVGTGDKASQVAAEGLFADGTDEDLGSGVRNAKASQESSGIEGTLNGMGVLLGGMANFMAATQGIKTPAAVATTAASTAATPVNVAPAVETAVASEALQATTAVLKPVTSVLPSISASAALNAKKAEAMSSGKPLVVIAGSPECGYCVRLENTLNGSAFLARTDIVVYREMDQWATNAALTWTGGGNAPILRVTQWDAGGKAICDKKVNRPQTIADLEAALSACVAP